MYRLDCMVFFLPKLALVDTMFVLPPRTPKKNVMTSRLWDLALPTVSLKHILDKSMCASVKSRLRLMMWLRVSSF